MLRHPFFRSSIPKAFALDFSGIIISRRSNTEKRHCFILRKKIILKQSHTWKKR